MTSTLQDQQAPAQALSSEAINSGTAKHRLSCTACSVPGNHRYSGVSQQRRNSQLKTLTPLSKSSSQDSLVTHKNNNSPHNNNSNNNRNHTLDLSNLASSSSSSSSSSSLQGSSGFKLNFNSGHSRPKIKCHIDHLHQDLELDVKLDGNEDNNNDTTNKYIENPSRFTLNCYNPIDPNKNIKLRVELVKTSAKGFGLRIVQHMPRPPSLTDSSNEASLASKKEKSKRNKSEGDSRHNSIRTESSKNIPKPNDISELDEVRISSGKLSKAGDDGEDHCRCTTRCGAPGCKAKEIPKEQEVNS